MPATGNSDPASPTSAANGTAALTPISQMASGAVSPSKILTAASQGAGQSGDSSGSNLSKGEDPSSQTAALTAAAAKREIDAVSPSKAYTAASQVAGEYGGSSDNSGNVSRLAGQAAAAAAGLASSGTPVTLPELAAAVRSYMAMHAAANPQAAPGVLLVA